MDEKTLELIEKLTDKVEALEESNKALSATVAKLAKEAGVKSKEDEADDDKAAEELLKSLAVVGKDMA